MAVITSFVGSFNSWTIILFFLSWFWKVLEDARCEITRNCYICAGWTGLVQEKNVISWCIIWGPGLARKPFTDCYSTRAVHKICHIFLWCSVSVRFCLVKMLILFWDDSPRIPFLGSFVVRSLWIGLWFSPTCGQDMTGRTKWQEHQQQEFVNSAPNVRLCWDLQIMLPILASGHSSPA